MLADSTGAHGVHPSRPRARIFPFATSRQRSADKSVTRAATHRDCLRRLHLGSLRAVSRASQFVPLVDTRPAAVRRVDVRDRLLVSRQPGNRLARMANGAGAYPYR